MTSLTSQLNAIRVALESLWWCLSLGLVGLGMALALLGRIAHLFQQLIDFCMPPEDPCDP